MTRILIIDDDESFRQGCRQILEQAGYRVFEAPDGEVGLRLFREQRAELIITDIFMPEKDGLETILAIRREFLGVKIIAISGGGQSGNFNLLEAAKRLGADRTLAKPFENQKMLATIQELLGRVVPNREGRCSVSVSLEG